jgi:hypothetical protein
VAGALRRRHMVAAGTHGEMNKELGEGLIHL